LNKGFENASEKGYSEEKSKKIEMKIENKKYKTYLFVQKNWEFKGQTSLLIKLLS
jgi:hypothetical protein